jgi:hypothetical protein
MAAKPNSNKWSDIQLAIAAVSMTAVIAFWNMFAGPDRTKADEKAAAEQQALLVPTVNTISVEAPVPEVAMPPLGYTILFGGAAPQPQVIVVRQPNGGGNNNANSGGGNAAPASQPAASTSSS